MTPADIKSLIETHLNNSQAQVTGEESQFEATVVSDAFEGLSMVRQHQLIYGILNDYIQSGEIHALTIKAYTPEQWSQLSNS